MSVQTAFQGEVQFRRYSDTSTQGQQVVFAVADREALESFIGKEGKRFMAVLVEIGDDEQPVAGNPASSEAAIGKTISKPNQRLGDLAYRAVQWCKEPEFRAWLGVAGDFVNELTEDAASEVIKGWCEVDSRKELDTNPRAKQLFNQLIRGPYQKHLMARGIN